MKTRLLLLLIPILFFSCSKEENNYIEDVWLNFYPRPVTEVLAYPAGLKLDEDFEYMKFDEWNGMKGEAIPVDAFYICFKTSDSSFRLDANLYELGEIDQSRLKEQPSNELERNMAFSFDKYLVTTRMVLKVVDYRTTGVSDLQITADVPFAGIAAGESLNDLFTLKDFIPTLVVNKDSEDIVVAWGDYENLPKSIGEWLAYEPLAQASIRLFLNVVPETLPEAIVFSIDLTTDTGEILHCDTPEVHLIR